MTEREGDPVQGQQCPRCRRQSVVYNGNYWCTRCSWVMGPQGQPRRIIAAYLVQRRDEELAAGNTEGVKVLEGYLRDYDGVTF